MVLATGDEEKMDLSAMIDMSSGISLAQTQEAASTLVLKSALDFQKSSGEETAQMLNSIPPSEYKFDMKV